MAGERSVDVQRCLTRNRVQRGRVLSLFAARQAIATRLDPGSRRCWEGIELVDLVGERSSEDALGVRIRAGREPFGERLAGADGVHAAGEATRDDGSGHHALVHDPIGVRAVLGM
jgi:hypothetical protein